MGQELWVDLKNPVWCEYLVREFHRNWAHLTCCHMMWVCCARFTEIELIWPVVIWCEYVLLSSQKLNSFYLTLSVQPKIKGRAVVLRNRERRKLFCHLGIDTERNQTQFQPNRFYCFHYIGLISNFANQMDFVPNSKSFVSSDSSRQNTHSLRFFRWTL